MSLHICGSPEHKRTRTTGISWQHAVLRKQKTDLLIAWDNPLKPRLHVARGGITIYKRIGKQYVLHNILISFRTPPPATVTTLGLTAATQEITSLREENLASARELLSQYLAGTMAFTERLGAICDTRTVGFYYLLRRDGKVLVGMHLWPRQVQEGGTTTDILGTASNNANQHHPHTIGADNAGAYYFSLFKYGSAPKGIPAGKGMTRTQAPPQIQKYWPTKSQKMQIVANSCVYPTGHGAQGTRGMADNDNQAQIVRADAKSCTTPTWHRRRTSRAPGQNSKATPSKCARPHSSAARSLTTSSYRHAPVSNLSSSTISRTFRPWPTSEARIPRQSKLQLLSPPAKAQPQTR